MPYLLCRRTTHWSLLKLSNEPEECDDYFRLLLSQGAPQALAGWKTQPFSDHPSAVFPQHSAGAEVEDRWTSTTPQGSSRDERQAHGSSL